MKLVKTKAKADEYATFESALKKVLTVSHQELKKRIKNASSSRRVLNSKA